MVATFSRKPRTTTGPSVAPAEGRAPEPAPGALSFDPWDPQFHRDPYPQYARLREEAALHPTRAETRAWVVTRYADCLALLRDPRVGQLEGFALQPAVSGSSRRSLRRRAAEREAEGRLLARAITPWTIQRLRPRLVELMECLVETLRERDDADLLPRLAEPMSTAAVCELLDVPPGDRSRFREWLPTLGRGVGVGVDARKSRDLSQAARRSGADYLAERVAADDRAPAGGLLTRLAVEGAADLASRDRVTLSLQLALAGYLVSRGLVANSLLAVLRHREVWSALVADPGLAGRVVEECVRWDPPLQLSVRVALCDFTLHGQPIEAGESLWLLLASANRDPRCFADADRFDPDRAGPPCLESGPAGPFGIGAELGRVAAEVTLRGLAQYGPRIVLAGEELERAPSALLRVPGRLPATLSWG